MRKGIIITIAIIACIFSIGATRYEPHQEEIDFAGQGFVKMHTTAYCMGHHTANGSKVHTGGCACNPHLGDVAIVYTLDGIVHLNIVVSLTRDTLIIHTEENMRRLILFAFLLTSRVGLIGNQRRIMKDYRMYFSNIKVDENGAEKLLSTKVFWITQKYKDTNLSKPVNIEHYNKLVYHEYVSNN